MLLRHPVVTSLLASCIFFTSALCWEQKCRPGHPCNIPGPERFTDKIAIVGGGPSGVHMAYLLKKRGFKHVKIFEAGSRVGGKSFTVLHRGTPHDMGTVYLAPDYEPNIIALAKEFELGKLVNLPPATIWKTYSKPQTFQKHVAVESMKILKTRSVNVAVKSLAVAIHRYIQLHVKLFGNYEGELMPRPSNETLYFIRGTFQDYLQRNNLYILRPFFVASQTIQGYGQLDEIPAFYGLLWNTPRMMKAITARLKGVKDAGVYMLSTGFQPLWQKIVDQRDLEVSYESTVIGVERWDNWWSSGVEITYKKHISPMESYYRREYFDFVMWTPELKLSLNKIDATDMERNLFEGTRPTYFSTTLMDSTNVSRGTTPIDYWYNLVLGKRDHVVWAQRDSFATFQGFEGTKYQNNSLPNGPDGLKKRSTVAYQMGSYRPKERLLHEILRLHFQKQGGEVNIRRTQTWRYFPRYDQYDIKKGIHWDILKMQGHFKMWYLGSSVCFESVKSVVEYNRLLVDIMRPPL